MGWMGWDSLRHEERLLQQTVGYTKPITFPQTGKDVVLETLKRSIELETECEAENIVVTYDFAIAKKSKQIQCAEQSTFENIFIQSGQFHTELNVFSSFLQLIEGSAGPHILGT